MSTGEWILSGNWPISTDCPSVNHNTGLTLLQLGTVNGYRLYYLDAAMTVQLLNYNPNTTLWTYGGTVSDDEQLTTSMASEFHTEGDSTTNITIATVRDLDNIEVSRLDHDEGYHICSSSFPMSALSE
jgi:hypothetical protein